MARYFRKGMKAKIHPRLTKDPYHLRGKTVKIQKVMGGVAIVKYKNIKGYYDKDALLKVRKSSKK